ncbi:hypothetical protein RHMOL_Rhmol03G0127100 [Rhododendron molle]|uniref:Uncharacterized protein n=1 Tax=Rhododendron molle TaxID=49168 RepID=A0ACC0PFW8_RHOML|nr:hypothetical protein RHMOL_Rhmol03G0127100 [Rhododendron molle]
MSEGFVNFSSILQAEESMAEEKSSMRRSSIIRALPNKGQSSSVKPSSPPAPLSRGSRRVPFFSASNIPSTITNEELAILRLDTLSHHLFPLGNLLGPNEHAPFLRMRLASMLALWREVCGSLFQLW